MTISLSDAAAQQVKKCLAERGRGLGIRLIVQSSECSGFTYNLAFVDEAYDFDLVFVNHGASVYIDPKSHLFLDGTEIDFSINGDESGFVVNNPNVKNRCGCGESFYV